MKKKIDSFLECLHPRATCSNDSKIVKRQEQGPEQSSRGLCAALTAGMGGRKLIDTSTAKGAGILSVLWTGLGNIIDLCSENWNTIFVIVIFPAALAFSFPLHFLVFSEGNTALVLLCHFGMIYFKIIVRDFGQNSTRLISNRVCWLQLAINGPHLQHIEQEVACLGARNKAIAQME